MRLADTFILETLDVASRLQLPTDRGESHRNVYARPCTGRAGIVRMQLGHDFVVGFDLEHLGEATADEARAAVDIVELHVGPDCDALQVAAIFGFEAAEQVMRASRTVAIPKMMSQVRRHASRVALLERFLEVPVLRHRRQKWTIELVTRTSSLAESGLDTEGSLRGHLKRLAQSLDLDFGTGRRAALDDGDLAEAISIGAAFLDPFEDEWIWFSDLDDELRDLRDPSSKLMEELEGTPTRDPREDTRGSSEPESDPHEEMALAGFRGDEREQDDAPKPDSWRSPLYWNLVDEWLAPEDGDFRSAVEVTIANNRAPTARVTVECPSELHRPPLYARIVVDRRATAMSALLSDRHGWSGSIAIPESFDSGVHHVEVMSSPTTPLLDDRRRAECEQWALLGLAQDDACQYSAYSRLQRDLLSDVDHADPEIQGS